jgi:Carboxypeptidase regulatory-like domain
MSALISSRERLYALEYSGRLFSIAANSGQIKGRVVDVTGAELPAFVRIIQADTAAVVSCDRTDHSGSFQTGSLADGSYSVTTWTQGFRRRELSSVIIENDTVTDLNKIQLEFSGCDAPGMNCYYVTAISKSNTSPKNNILGSGHPRMSLLRGIDIDMQLTKDGSNLYLAAMNGAKMSIQNSRKRPRSRSRLLRPSTIRRCIPCIL